MLSGVVLTKNEESIINECLRKLKFCDEIIIVDDFSEDKTLQIAQKYTQRIYQRHLNNDFAGQRNFALTKTKGEWILFIDADEIVSPNLAYEIKKVIRNSKFNSFFIKRKDIFLGKQMHFGEVANIQLLRLAKKNSGVWRRPVHETWEVIGKTGVLQQPLLHFAHNNLTGLIKKINFYSTINADYLFSRKVKAGTLQIIIYPLTKFTLNYLFKKGFLDGFEGFLLSIFMSFHSFLTRAKLFLRNYEKN